MKILLNVLFISLLMPINVFANEHLSEPSTREMERINWMEFSGMDPQQNKHSIASHWHVRASWCR